MDRLIGKSILLGFTTVSMMLALSAVPVYAQETNSAPAVSSANDGGSQTCHKHGKRHGKRGLFMGMCVGQYLLSPNTNPTVTFTPGQKLTKAQWASVKAAKKACRAEFKAAHPSSGGSGSGSGTSDGTQE